MWRNVIEKKYRVDNYGRWNKKSSYAHGVSCWKSIISSVDHFHSHVQYRVKNGSKILFGMMCGVVINLSSFDSWIFLEWFG